MIFAKDERMHDPALYLIQEENAVIGEWAAESEELWGRSISDFHEGVHAMICNWLTCLDFVLNRNATVIYVKRFVTFSHSSVKN